MSLVLEDIPVKGVEFLWIKGATECNNCILVYMARKKTNFFATIRLGSALKSTMIRVSNKYGMHSDEAAAIAKEKATNS